MTGLGSVVVAAGKVRRSARKDARLSKLVGALMKGRTITDAASLLGVAERTARRWLEKPEADAMLRSRAGETLARHERGLLALSDEMLASLKALISHTNPKVRLGALNLGQGAIDRLADRAAERERDRPEVARPMFGPPLLALPPGTRMAILVDGSDVRPNVPVEVRAVEPEDQARDFAEGIQTTLPPAEKLIDVLEESGPEASDGSERLLDEPPPEPRPKPLPPSVALDPWRRPSVPVLPDEVVMGAVIGSPEATCEQLAKTLKASPISVRNALLALHRLGLVERMSTEPSGGIVTWRPVSEGARASCP